MSDDVLDSHRGTIRGMVDSLHTDLYRARQDKLEDEAEVVLEDLRQYHNESWHIVKETVRFMDEVFRTNPPPTCVTPYRVKQDELHEPEEVLLTFRAKDRKMVIRYKCDERKLEVIKFVATLDDRYSNQEELELHQITPLAVAGHILNYLNRFIAKVDGMPEPG